MKDTKALAARLNLDPHTLENWRVLGIGPAFHKLGNRVMYSDDDVAAWLAQQRRTSTSDRGPTAART